MLDNERIGVNFANIKQSRNGSCEEFQETLHTGTQRSLEGDLAENEALKNKYLMDMLKLKVKLKLILQKKMNLDETEEEKSVILDNAYNRIEKQIDYTKEVIKKLEKVDLMQKKVMQS